ncbi:diadenosine tetraphosphate (Ap4A) HIT family hydrolase [Saccharothrix coeruleofusca]|uniref:HIT family protein n=1 Tax=Saccharothrix coeruleofusca TaxID=33919 RepID=UPI001AE8B1F3|nr:HIT domain-containing protein [Saccharothrix coeruleofusca]MBP2340148.1 diadenosine tetraphosphate (Ap4A) HIT family hydrolase [Saccharothrix coeruleofusca]
MGQPAAVGEAIAGARVACLFCQVHDASINELLLEGAEFYVRWDNYPAAKGHVEIVPKRHVESYFDLTEQEAAEAYEITKQAQRMLDAKYHPAGYTIGINEGRAAGRTVDHLHIHLIPRYEGDVADPRGGVRHVLPGTDVDAWGS